MQVVTPAASSSSTAPVVRPSVISNPRSSVVAADHGAGGREGREAADPDRALGILGEGWRGTEGCERGGGGEEAGERACHDPVPCR